MKKSFFRKLSFVLALAMIVSVIAPAAGAFAATKPAVNTSKKYLFLGESGKNEYDFNVKNKISGSTYEWSSDNESVAVVDDKGYTTAKSVGTATISLLVTDKKGNTYPSEATVIVKDNIKSLAITNKPANDTVAVGAENDFNRSFTTQGGSTKKTTSVTRWVVTDADGKATDKATIDNSGVFKATEAGTYKVTANAFQSTAKYDTWKTSGDSALIQATDTTTVTVKISLTKVELVNPTKLKLTFDSSVADKVKSASDVSVKQKVTDTISALIPIKSIDSVSADGKTVIVSVYDNLVDKTTYKVTAVESTFELYVQIGTPVSISMENQTTTPGTYTVAFTLLDQYGVDISSLYVGSIVKSSSLGWTNSTAGTLTLAAGQVAFVSYSYDIINSDGTVKTITTGTKSITCAAASITGTFEANLYSSVAYGSSAFATAKTAIALNTTAYLNGRALMSNGDYNYAGYSFESMTTGIAMVDRTTGLVTPVTAGTALIKAYDASGNVVGYFNITVTAASATASVKASATSVALSNAYANAAGVTVQESATVDIINVDQYGTETAATIDATNFGLASGACYVASTTRLTDLATITLVDSNTISFTAVAGKSGTFVYVVKTTEGKAVTITVTVGTPGTLATYNISSDTTLDSYVNNPDTASAINFTVYGVDANGYKKSVVVNGVTAPSVTYTVVGPNAYSATGFSETLTDADLDGTVTFDLSDILDTSAKPGTYTFTVTIGGIAFSKTFTVNNTRPATEINISAVSLSVANGTLLTTALENLIDLEVSDVDQTITSATFVSGNSALLTDGGTAFSATNDGTFKLYVKTVTFTNTADGAVITVDINRDFTITVY